MERIGVAFLFVGGAHQVLHAAPAAAELSRDGRFEVVCLIAGDAERAMIARVATVWPEAHFAVEALSLPRWLQRLARRIWPSRNLKLPLLLCNLSKLAGYDAIVTPERTSTVLKSLGVRRMIHIPHGAGDRAKGFERRIRRFDYVIVQGRKDAERMIAAGLVRPENCAASGSVKLGAIERFGRDLPRIFDNDRPTVLYNPHFSSELGSWSRWGERIVAAFAAQDEVNLIVAPHVRLFQDASATARAAFEALSVPGRILCDAGSPRCCDMTYTLAADIYLGDVSSQVYEFLSRPRPCVFLNAQDAGWRGNPDYRCWNFGEVVDDAAAVPAAVRRAPERHGEFLSEQQAMQAEALGDDWQNAPARAADLIRDYLLRGQEPQTV
jgi:hypothetical protein